MIYLGGNEQSTHKYISELLGKSTIDKRAIGETRGRQGSSSRNYDVLGRELMTPDEARKFDNKKCLIFIRGFDQIVDDKYFTPSHPAFFQSADGKGNAYVHIPREQQNNISGGDADGGKAKVLGIPFQMLTPQSVKYFEKLEKKGENVQIATLKLEELMILDDLAMKKEFIRADEQEQIRKAAEESGNEIVYQIPEEEKKSRHKDSILLRLSLQNFSEEQRNEVMVARSRGVPQEIILTYFYPEVSVGEMRKKRDEYLSSARG